MASKVTVIYFSKSFDDDDRTPPALRGIEKVHFRLEVSPDGRPSALDIVDWDEMKRVQDLVRSDLVQRECENTVIDRIHAFSGVHPGEVGGDDQQSSLDSTVDAAMTDSGSGGGSADSQRQVHFDLRRNRQTLF